MGVFDKFLDIMKLNDDEYDDDDFYDDDFEDDDFDEKPHRSIFGNKKSRSDDFDDFDMDEDKHLAYIRDPDRVIQKTHNTVSFPALFCTDDSRRFVHCQHDHLILL